MSAPCVGTSTGYSTNAKNVDHPCQFTGAGCCAASFHVIEDKLVSIVIRTARYCPAGISPCPRIAVAPRSEEHTSELQSQSNLVCRLLLEKKKKDSNRCLSY